MENLWSAIKAWSQAPFKQNMGVAGWALFVGLLVILCFLWSRVLAHIIAETK